MENWLEIALIGLICYVMFAPDDNLELGIENQEGKNYTFKVLKIWKKY